MTTKTARELCEAAKQDLRQTLTDAEQGRVGADVLNAKAAEVEHLHAAAVAAGATKTASLASNFSGAAELGGTGGGYASKSGAPVGGLGKAMLDAGFNLKSKPSVDVSAFDVMTKNSVFPAATAWPHTGPTGFREMGHDRRFLGRPSSPTTPEPTSS